DLRAKRLTGKQGSARNDALEGTRDPNFPRKRIFVGSNPPPKRSAQRAPKALPQTRVIFRSFAQLIVEQKEFEHLAQAREFFTLKPWQGAFTQRQIDPFVQRLRFTQAQFAQLRPNRNSGIWRENIRRETDVPKLPGNVAHGAKSFNTIGFGLTGIPENEINRYVNPAKGRFPSRFVHFVKMLMSLVH